MPGKAAKTIITEQQQEILRTFSRSVTAPSRLRQRAAIIVLAFGQGKGDVPKNCRCIGDLG